MTKRLTIMVPTMIAIALLMPLSPIAAASPGTTESVSSASVLTWERISIRTIYTDNVTPIPVGALYLGFTSLAMNEAAQAARERRGSMEAAVATAAHDVLGAYFPASTVRDAELAASLAAVQDARARQRGQEAGARAAAEMIASRVGDGRGDPSIIYNRALAPGVWQPAAGGAMLAPWLGFVDPLILRQPIRARGVDGPPALSSSRYATEFNEVKRVGSLTAPVSDRTAEQSEIARFFNSNSAIMVSEGLLRYLDAEPMRLADSARLFAVMHAAMSDAIITCWRLKYDVGFWRPFQAISGADGDGNPATVATSDWQPLIANPPYSDYVSGHGCLTAPAVEAIRDTLGERTPLTLHSFVTNTDRTYPTLRGLEQDAFNARIWGGLHFRTAMRDAYAIGHTAADQVLRKLR